MSVCRTHWTISHYSHFNFNDTNSKFLSYFILSPLSGVHSIRYNVLPMSKLLLVHTCYHYCCCCCYILLPMPYTVISHVSPTSASSLRHSTFYFSHFFLFYLCIVYLFIYLNVFIFWLSSS